MTHPPVVVVDEHDHEIGKAMLAEVWEKGLYHRIVHIIAEDEDGRVLLQHRAADAKLWPNCWDHSAGGHVDEGFTYDSAARAEVAEELGLQEVQLEAVATHPTRITHNGHILNRFTRLYRIRITKDTPLRINEEELSATRWFTLPELRAALKTRPQDFTDVLRYTIETYYPEKG